MSRKKAILLGIWALSLAALLAGLAGTRILAAQDSPADGYIIDWWTVDGGGGASQSSTYELIGTAGQPDVGRAVGGPYTLKGGFWGSSGLDRYLISLPFLNR